MSTLSTSVRQPRDARLTIAGIAGFSVALALASQVAIPLPFTPVPITLQPLVVVLAGLMLGPAAGAASMVLYLAAGAAGLPVFTPLGAPGIARFFGTRRRHSSLALWRVVSRAFSDAGSPRRQASP